MDRAYRTAFNAAYTPDFYRSYMGHLQDRLGKIPFRVAETPMFLPIALRDRLAKHAREIVEQISAPGLIAKLSRSVPPELDVPRRDALCNCIQVDFAITRDANGQLDGRLVELQGFPSLYAFTAIQTEVLRHELRKLPGLDRTWTSLFGNPSIEEYVARLRRALVGDCDPSEVILMDLDPPSQKTVPDFIATKQLLGIDAVCPTQLDRHGRELVREVNGKKVAVRRIYNRVVFDELLKKGVKLPFSYTEDLDVSWVPHPNWYWIWSKYTIPYLDHPSIPRARFLNEVSELPDDLANFVLKPLFSFAGTGVIVDVRKEDVDAIPHEQRVGWLLQEKIPYEPGLVTPEGHGIKAEVRMMFLRAPDQEKPELMLNLVRLSRGKMLGVDHNKNFDWVGGTAGIWAAEDG